MRYYPLFAPLRILLAIASVLFVGSAQAANWYVRPNSAGFNNGKDWNNAWSLSSIDWSAVNAGDTVWLAGGIYGAGLTVNKSGSSDNPIKIYRALSSDSVPASAVGWNNSFDNQVKLPGGTGISIPTSSHIIVDGRIAYGILITISQRGGYGITCGQTNATSGDLKFYYVDVLGPYGSVSNPVGSEVIGWKISPSTNTLSNILFDHCRIKGVGVGAHCLASNVTIEYCYIADVASDDGTERPYVLHCSSSPNMTWRYNTIVNCSVDGLFFENGGAFQFYFYGNLYYNTGNQQIYFNGPDTYGPVYIYNNTFHAPSTSQYGSLDSSHSIMNQGAEVYNNIFFNVLNSLSGVTTDYNAYNYTTLDSHGWPSSEAHSFAFTASPFVNLGDGTQQPPGNSFELTPASAPTFRRGKTLVSDGFINKDMNGILRGIDGSWEIGAYENNIATPPEPTNLRVVH